MPEPEVAEAMRSAVFTDPNDIKSSGKKRVRRIQVELPFYRQQVEELEFQLKRLKLQKSSATVNLRNTTQQREANVGSVWDDIAERQLKERVRVEQQNEELKTSHNELRKFSMELQKVLQKCQLNNQELAERVKFKPKYQFWNLTTEADDEIFSEQLTIVTRMYLELQQRWNQYQAPSRAIHFTWDLSLGKEVVKLDPSVNAGVVLESRNGAVLPFKLDVVVEAFWKFFGYAHGGDAHCIMDDECSMESLSRSFSLQMDFEGLFSQLVGKYTCRKFITDNEITLVWVECADISEFGGAKFNGLQYLKRGHLKLRRVPREGPGEQSTSTTLESYSETIPVFREGTKDQAVQTRDLITVVQRSYSRVNKVFCQTMSSMLLEEDWKASMITASK